jgi:uncharacterized protein (TIGR02246 family)
MPKVGLLIIPSILVASALTLAIAQGSSAADEAAIKGIVKVLEEGWNAGDSGKFASPFSANADYVIVDGKHIRTRPVIDFGHKQIFNTVYKGSINKSEIKQIRFLRPDVAVVHVEWMLKHGDKLEKTNRAMNSLVVIKEAGKWEITAFHNTPIQ